MLPVSPETVVRNIVSQRFEMGAPFSRVLGVRSGDFSNP